MKTYCKRINLFGVNMDLFSMEETLERISEIIANKKPAQHVVVNVAKLVYAQKDEILRNIINSCELINIDGAGVVLGAKLLGIKVPERVTGIDLMQKLIAYSSEKNYKIYFFGAEEHVIQKVIETYKQKYPDLMIAGYRNGYYTSEQEKDIVENIRNSKADILFVAMGSPKKEIFLNKYLNEMEVPFVMGVGGSFDIAAGKVKRAPIWVQKLNSEWIYRLIQEPKRMWKRYLITNTTFSFMLLKQFTTQKFSLRIKAS